MTETRKETSLEIGTRLHEALEARSQARSDRVKEVNQEGNDYCLKAYVVNQPEAHPLWSEYAVSIVHLREGPNGEKANKRHEDNTHEVIMSAIDPKVPYDIETPSSIKGLSPNNLSYQVKGMTDRQVLKVFEAFIDLMAIRRICANSDYRSLNEQWWNNATKSEKAAN